MKLISVIIVPIFVLFVIIYSFFKKIDIYSSFLEGAKDGLKIVLEITPAILAMIFATNLFVNSNILNIISIKGVSKEIIPLALLKPISNTASLGILTSIFERYGPDSFTGLLASVLQGCTDTTIYVIALYYSTIKVKNIRHTLMVGLIADVIGIVVGIILCNIFF